MKIHQRFKLNGVSYSNKELFELAHELVKGKEAYKNAIGSFIINWLDVSKTITVSTSGSTGKPKQLLLKKEQMVNSALATGIFFKLKEGNTALLCLPCDFIAGKMMLVRAMVLGLELDFVAPSSNPIINNTKKYNFAAMIPLQAENAIANLELIDKLIIGGAPLSKNLEDRLQLLKTSIFSTYGMTETITHIAVRKLGKPYFKTLPEITLKKDNRECLVIHAPKIIDDAVVTNDIVDLISNGEFKWLGRYDTVINSGGIKLIPEQIEAKLNQLITNRFFVTGIADKVLGEKLVLFVEGRQDASLLEKVKSIEQLSKYQIPKEVYFLPKFIATDNGKLNRPKTLQLLKR